MIWDCILCNCILLNWWLCNIVKSIGYVFEHRYEKYVFYDMTFIFGMFIIAFVKCFISRKILKAYYGFRVLYVFPFPSAGHWPKGGSGRDMHELIDQGLQLKVIKKCILAQFGYDQCTWTELKQLG